MALVATYEDPARHLVKSVGFSLPLAWCWLLLAVVAGFAVLAFRQGRFAVLAVAGLALVPLLAAPLSGKDTSGWPVAIIYSFVLLATASALITLLVILRMADADVSLLVKGLAFIVIGVGFLGFNIFISRRRAALPGGPSA
jgi:hypothetical protein